MGSNRRSGPGCSSKSLSQVVTLSKKCVVQPPTFGHYFQYASVPKPCKGKDLKTGSVEPKKKRYRNVMFDSHVFRGATHESFNESNTKKCRKEAKLKKKMATAAAKSRLKRQAMSQAKEQKNIVDISFPDHLKSETKNASLGDMGIQTDKFLIEVVESVGDQNISTQTDKLWDVEQRRGQFAAQYLAAKQGHDVGTHLSCNELCDKDSVILPVSENIARKLLEQSMIEVMEDEELAYLFQQYSVYQAAREKEISRLKRLRERELSLQHERIKLIEKRQKEKELEIDVNNRIRVAKYTSTFLTSLIADSMDILAKEGFLKDRRINGINTHITPWMNALVEKYMQNPSNNIIDGIIRQTVTRREAEVAENLWREISEKEADKEETSLSDLETEGHLDKASNKNREAGA